MTPFGTRLMWTGRVITGLTSAMFLMSAVMKLIGGETFEQEMTHLGLPGSMVVPLAILEITCVVIYLVPSTSILGAILLTGYLGGAICTHWRVGDAFVMPAVLGVLVWLGLYLRDPLLKELVPLRSR